MGVNQGKLYKPIKDGDLAAIRAVLDDAGDEATELINEQFNTSSNPLEFAPVYYSAIQYAVSRQELEITKLLLERGADIHCRRNAGETLLHVAVHQGNLPLVDVLRTHGIDMQAVDEKGHYAIHRACRSYNDPGTMISYLLEHGNPSDVNVTDFSGQTPLHHAAFGSNYPAATVLIERGADVNANDEIGRTPFHAAKKQEKMKEILISHGADPNLPDPLYGEQRSV